ncbi:long-chain-fatty-acid--CoA ligase [Candidatus Thiosymbion oneisti]|uniref:long-chain-fatty-acid--CoA ligase n=1 Tax=Candidatus Thiosymbion oneisti TaxID=589554 RepID=UPI000B1E58D2|nr:long-chain fatty acid--CoA ligase [Candidatus Thiosymbion oneisti]
MSISTGSRDTIPDSFRAVACARGDQPVLLGVGPSWTFATLDRASDGIAVGLAGRGVEPGDRIGLYCPNTPEFVAAYLGILKAGATVVPINLMLNPKEIVFILSDAGAKGFCYHQALAEVAQQARGLAPELGLSIRIGNGDGTDPSLDELMATPGRPPTLRLDADRHLAVILYTSGTTGRPKGAMLSHTNLRVNTASIRQALHLEPGRDRVLVVLPLFHAFAATVGMLTPLLHGLGSVIVGQFDPKSVSAAIAEYGATIFLGVPSMYNLLLRLEDQARNQWASVRFCVSGGAAMPQALMASFEERFDIPILEGDGPTECAPVTCVNPLAGPRKPGSVGLPIPGVEMRVAGPDGVWLADSEHGEVCVRGANVMQGYWGLEAQTRESFFGDWFRTGDLGYRDADGYFFLVDRIKDLIISNGMNVYPRMIEEVLYRYPDIAEAAVVGEPHRLHGEIPVAFVVPKPGARLDPARLRDWCKEHLGRHEIPRRLELREDLPRNAAGKILKRELRRQGELERGIDSP